jgi:hypothetical protein
MHEWGRSRGFPCHNSHLGRSLLPDAGACHRRERGGGVRHLQLWRCLAARPVRLNPSLRGLREGGQACASGLNCLTPARYRPRGSCLFSSTHSRSRGACRPSFALNLLTLLIRGRRECQAPMRRGKKCARSSHGHTGITRHSPRNGFTVSFVLSPAIGLFCHRHRRNCFHRLDTSVEMSGPHDFTVRSKPRRQRAATSTASRPDVRDVRETPLCVGRDVDGYRLIRNFGKSEYFYQRGFTDFWVICPSGRFVEGVEEIGVRKNS